MPLASGLLVLGAGSLLGAHEVSDATRDAARAAEFHPYSASGLFGSANINENTRRAELSLSPQYQLLHNALFGRVMGRLGIDPELLRAAVAPPPQISQINPFANMPFYKQQQLFGRLGDPAQQTPRTELGMPIMRGFARGGFPLPGETSVMGERGPEILRTPAGTQVVGAGGPQLVNTPSGGQVIPLKSPSLPGQTPGTIPNIPGMPGYNPNQDETGAFINLPQEETGQEEEDILAQQGYNIPSQEELGMISPSENTQIMGAMENLRNFDMPFGLSPDAQYSEVLGLLRQQAAPGEEQRRLELENRLAAQGMLGGTGGALRTRSLREAQEQADLARQLQAFGTTVDINQLGYGRAGESLNRELGLYAADQQSIDANRARLMQDLNMLFGIGSLPNQYGSMGLQAGAAGAAAGANQGQFIMQGGQTMADIWSGLGAGLFGGLNP